MVIFSTPYKYIEMKQQEYTQHMDQNQFDKKIKESLENIEIPFNAAHWAQMEATLSGIEIDNENIDSQQIGKEDTSAFDSLISDKLGNLEAGMAVPNWERMAEALDGAGVESKDFDTEVKTKINFLNPTYQPSHWEILAARLRREKAVKESLFKNKLSELVLLVLLLLNFNNYFPNFPEVTSFPAENSALVEPNKETVRPAKESKPVVSKQVIRPIASTIAKKANLATKEQVTEHIADNYLYISPALATIDINGIATQRDLEERNFGIDGKTGLTITIPEMTRHLDYVGLANSIFLEPLPSLVPTSLATTSILPLDCETCSRHKMYSRFRFGMVFHVGGTSAARSADQLLSTSALVQKGGGYGSGFTLGFKYGKFEIETGLTYAAKTYAPNINDPYSSYGGRTNLKQFTGINLQTFQVPLNLRYNYAVLGNGKWHLYAQNGVAMNVILRAQYDITDKPQTNIKQLGQIAATSRLSKISFNKGILGGDSFKENRFFTVNLGAGAEYYMSPKWSVFMQPDFHYYISQSRIGPTKDRINSLSVSFGVKASFH